jgi:hypothetical protein
LLRHLFEMTVARCIEEGLVSGQRMAVDASLIEADANKQNSTPKDDWDAARIDPADAPRAVREYLETLDEAAFGAASEVQPKFTSHSDPASQWTAARKGPAFFSYSDNDLIDTDHGVILDVEATRSIRQAEVGSTKTMLERVKARFDLHPERLIAPSRDIATQCPAGQWTPPTAPDRCWAGWSTARLPRTSPFSINRGAATGPGGPQPDPATR